MNPQPTAAEPVIELAGVEKVYRSGRAGFPALSGVNLTITAGEMVAVTGPSGSGKSAIINLTAVIDRPTAGTVTVAGRAQGRRQPQPRHRRARRQRRPGLRRGQHRPADVRAGTALRYQ